MPLNRHHTASGRSSIPSVGMATHTCPPTGKFYVFAGYHGRAGQKRRPSTTGRKAVTDFIVLVADAWMPRFSLVLAMIKGAGAKITDVCAETGIFEGVIARANLDALSRLPCVGRLTPVLTYISKSGHISVVAESSDERHGPQPRVTL